ncbi:MAG: hypothetical protein OEM16_12810 [Myxococcales bacterium]|nr:hypothetical protein [Myxococcales bacterium]
MPHALPIPSPTRKRLATVIAVVGLAVVGGQLARVWPRDVEVAYQPSPEVRRVDVDIVQDGEAVTTARFNRVAGDDSAFFHTLSLQPGQYRARITVYGSNGRGVEHSRPLTVPADGVTRFDLRE